MPTQRRLNIATLRTDNSDNAAGHNMKLRVGLTRKQILRNVLDSIRQTDNVVFSASSCTTVVGARCRVPQVA
jgi:hypothetical protein